MDEIKELELRLGGDYGSLLVSTSSPRCEFYKRV